MKGNVLTPEVKENRQAGHDIDPVFLNRWSPRSYKTDPVSDEVLSRLFEAARWAPSGSNEQPWRFIVARTQEDKERFYPFIAEGNRIWCEKAPVLVLLLSKTISSRGTALRSHALDAGAAWGYLALEATRQDLVTHAMGGFDPQKAREDLGIPSEYEPQIVIAIGYQGVKEELPEALQEREKPSTRQPLESLVFEGVFSQK
ncbi:nitroreductase family protein [Brevibacillus panacihumi]|uniref:nitroreductase family protein n=1 Tax=Brevibacillus panacihumi TaxID=497735 RepID=UPI003CFD7364